MRERLCAGVGEGVEPVYSENIVTSYSCIYHCTDSLVLVDRGGGRGGVGRRGGTVYSENIVTSYSCIYHCIDSLVLVDSVNPSQTA